MKNQLKKSAYLILSTMSANALAEDINEVYIGESVISASGYEQNLKDAPASISVIKPQDLKSRPVRDIAEAIANVPGVSIDSSVSKTGGYGISIRGMGSGYTLMLNDGKRVNGDSALFPNGFGDSVTSFMPPLSAIERIEVIRGPASTLYGSDAMGGVVNIITKQNFKKWGASAGINYTLQESDAFGTTLGANLFTAGPLTNGWGLILRGNVNKRLEAQNLKVVPNGTNGTFKDARRNEIVGLAPMVGYNLGGRIIWSDSATTYSGLALNNVYVDADYSQLSYDNSQGLLGNYKPETGRAESGYGAQMNIYRFNSTINHKGNYIDDDSATLQKLGVETSLQYNITANPNRYVPKDTFSNGTQSANGVSKGDSREILGNDIILDSKAQILFYFNPIVSLNLTAGGRYWYNNFKDNLFAVAGKNALQEQHIGALFSEGEVILFDRLFITAGLRGNFNSIFGANASPRAYIAYNILDKWLTIKGGVSTGYKTPALSNLINGVANLSGQGKTHTYGNPNLRPEQSVNYELSLISDNEYFNAQVTGFYTDFSNKISTISGAPSGFTCSANGGSNGGSGNGCSHYVNVGKAQTYGAEVALGSKPINIANHGDLSINTAYTFTASKITKDSNPKNIGTRLTNVPLHSFNASLNYDSEFIGGYIRGEIKAGIYRGNPATNAEAKALGEFYKPIYLMHLGAYIAPTKHLRINFAVYNLLGQDFIDYVAYNGSSYANNYNYIREGRRYFTSLQFEF